MSKTLPPNPNLEYDKKQAKVLLKAYQAGDADALNRVRVSHPGLEHVPETRIAQDEFKLSDAQLVIAREYGFSSWPRLKNHIDIVRAGLDKTFQEFVQAVTGSDAAQVRRLLEATPALAKRINDPVIDFDAPPLVIAAGRNNRELVDVLIEHGADVNAKSAWWAGAFGVLHNTAPEMVQHLIERGAEVDAHAAAQQGMMDVLQTLVEADPAIVHAKGPDGQRPLHFARSIPVIDYLLDHGADINARDVDHRGSAAQWLLGDHSDLARYLIKRGAEADIFMACALGEGDLVRTLLDADPDAVNRRIGGEDYPLVPPAPGLHIYIYSLGNNKSPHQIARQYGHNPIYQHLLERSSPQRRFIAACERADAEVVRSLLKNTVNSVTPVPDQDQQLLADAAWENNVAGVKVMLEAGFDPSAVSADGWTALHRAAFHGFIDIVTLLLSHNVPLTGRNQYGATPLDCAIYGSVHSWHRDGDFPATVEALMKAGSKLKPDATLTGNDAVDAVLRRYLGDSKPDI